jgi:hypothetical protein
VPGQALSRDEYTALGTALPIGTAAVGFLVEVLPIAASPTMPRKYEDLFVFDVFGLDRFGIHRLSRELQNRESFSILPRIARRLHCSPTEESFDLASGTG